MSTPLAAPALPVFPTQPRGKQDVDHCSNEHICDGRGVLRFGVHARAKSRVRDQGQHQLQRRAHLPRAGTALLRQDRNQLEQRGTLVLHRAGSCRCRLAKKRRSNFPGSSDLVGVWRSWCIVAKSASSSRRCTMQIVGEYGRRGQWHLLTKRRLSASGSASFRSTA
jgi:hypothetical protein